VLGDHVAQKGSLVAPTACASTSATQAHRRRRARPGRGHRQPGAAPERARGHQAHGRGRGDRVRRPRAVRREVRRRGRVSPWAAPPSRDGANELSPSSSAGGTHVERTATSA
jgi:hypothetical protein